MIQSPSFYPGGDHRIEFEAVAVVSQPAQTSGMLVRGKIQLGRILQKEIFPRLATALARPLPVRFDHSLIAHLRITKQSVGRFQLTPLRQSLRQRAAGALRDRRSYLNQPS